MTTAKRETVAETVEALGGPSSEIMPLRGVTEQSVALLRAPFAAEQIGKLPRGGTNLDFVGHAAVTDRLLSVDPFWSWEPVAFDTDGCPLIRHEGKRHTLWIRLTVLGVTRLGVGIVTADKDELEKELISDALRNAAMRFGVALDLWSKTPLGLDGEHSGDEEPQRYPADPSIIEELRERVAMIRASDVAIATELAGAWRAVPLGSLADGAQQPLDKREVEHAERLIHAAETRLVEGGPVPALTDELPSDDDKWTATRRSAREGYRAPVVTNRAGCVRTFERLVPLSGGRCDPA